VTSTPLRSKCFVGSAIVALSLVTARAHLGQDDQGRQRSELVPAAVAAAPAAPYEVVTREFAYRTADGLAATATPTFQLASLAGLENGEAVGGSIFERAVRQSDGARALDLEVVTSVTTFRSPARDLAVGSGDRDAAFAAASFSGGAVLALVLPEGWPLVAGEVGIMALGAYVPLRDTVDHERQLARNAELWAPIPGGGRRSRYAPTGYKGLGQMVFDDNFLPGRPRFLGSYLWSFALSHLLPALQLGPGPTSKVAEYAAGEFETRAIESVLSGEASSSGGRAGGPCLDNPVDPMNLPCIPFPGLLSDSDLPLSPRVYEGPRAPVAPARPRVITVDLVRPAASWPHCPVAVRRELRVLAAQGAATATVVASPRSITIVPHARSQSTRSSSASHRSQLPHSVTLTRSFGGFSIHR